MRLSPASLVTSGSEIPIGSGLKGRNQADTDLAAIGRDPCDSRNGRLHFCRIYTATSSVIAPQSALIFILAHLIATALVALPHHLLAVPNRTP